MTNLTANNESDKGTVKLTQEKAATVTLEKCQKYLYSDRTLQHTHKLKQANREQESPVTPMVTTHQGHGKADRVEGYVLRGSSLSGSSMESSHVSVLWQQQKESGETFSVWKYPQKAKNESEN